MKKSFMEEYKKEKDEHIEKARNQLNEVCKILKPLGVTAIEADYDGCGDSGAVEEVRFYSKGKEYKGNLPQKTFESLFCYPGREADKVDLKGTVDEICCNFLPGGWEINEGSFGVIKIDIKKKTLKVEHNERYEETNYSEEEFKL